MKSNTIFFISLLILAAASMFFLGSPKLKPPRMQTQTLGTADSEMKSHLPIEPPRSPDSMPPHAMEGMSHANESLKPLPEISHATVAGPDTIEVPHGAKVPSVLMDNGGPADEPWVRESMAEMEADFLADFESTKKTGVPVQEAWEQARERADARYTAIFGLDAFLEASSAATDEANEELSKKK